MSSRPGDDVTEARKSSNGIVLGGEQREAEPIGLRTAGLHPEPTGARRRLRGRQPHGGRRGPGGRRQRRRLLALLHPEDGERGTGTAPLRLEGIPPTSGSLKLVLFLFFIYSFFFFLSPSAAAHEVPQAAGGDPTAEGAAQPEGRAHQAAGAGD